MEKNEEPAPSQRACVRRAMAQRPGDPWPSGEGHVVLGEPGSPREQKAYHEPGGLFSPCPGSFGISFWVVDAGGNRVACGESLLPGQYEQSYRWGADGAPPSIHTETAHYAIDWAVVAHGHARGSLAQKVDGGSRIVAVVRSVGPAGGPLHRIDWDGRQLILEHRWVVGFEAVKAVHVRLGDEALGELGKERRFDRVESPTGWACAQVEFGIGVVQIEIRDSAPSFPSPLPCRNVRSGLSLKIPEGPFGASLDAQAANLLMGFVGDQTRPGEPTNYPLAWERDGAMAVIAMARAGRIETAMRLCAYFAEHDFFGGFGAEGDAPGSSINALVETALASGDRAFREWAWPRVRRKAAIIREMRAATGALRRSWVGPIVPIHRGKEILPVICEAAKDGLITGTMDNHFPILYVNAISYRGLRMAARLAQRVGESAEAAELSREAAGLREAWLRQFPRNDLENERTWVSALWPTWTIPKEHPSFRERMASRWEKIHHAGQFRKRPLWTYFTLAEAHQWLLLGEHEKAWDTLHYFWANQCSPGLYTFWEGDGEENSFGLWEEIRGWVHPRHVTPHYWTAAEMLLLQLDMLAHVDESGEEPLLVVGAGVPNAWLGERLEIDGIHTSLGVVSWSWSDRKVEVRVRSDQACTVRLGKAFGPNTRVETVFTR